MEGSSCGLVYELSWHFQGGTEENHKNPVRIICVPTKIRNEYLQKIYSLS
jgi:hypothetical protein